MIVQDLFESVKAEKVLTEYLNLNGEDGEETFVIPAFKSVLNMKPLRNHSTGECWVRNDLSYGADKNGLDMYSMEMSRWDSIVRRRLFKDEKISDAKNAAIILSGMMSLGYSEKDVAEKIERIDASLTGF